jgi:SAM-dependent methyltransferase
MVVSLQIIMPRLKNFDTESLTHFWDELARSIQDTFYSEKNATDIYLQKTYLNILNHFQVDPLGQKILKLDLWNESTNTVLLKWFFERGAEIYGIDISPEVVQRAKVKFEQRGIPCDLRQGDIRKIPFPDAYFDMVYSIGTIEHVPEVSKVFQEIYRVMRDGGEHIVGVPNRYNIWGRAFAVWLAQQFGLYPFGFSLSFSRDSLSKMLKDTGFRDIETTGVILYPWVIRYINLHPHARHFAWINKVVRYIILPFSYLEFGYTAHLGEFLIAKCRK